MRGPHRRAAAYARGLAPGLPRSVWTLELGFFLNALGTGIAYPFLVIYLHNVRGLSLGTAGLVVATMGVASLVAGPLCGRLVDRIGARTTLTGALVVSAAGYALFPFVHEAWEAFGAAVVVGAGSGGFWPSQSTLLAGLAPPSRRHAAYAVQRGAYNLGLGLGGVTGGLIASTETPETFTVLFALDAAMTLAFCAVLRSVPDPFAPPHLLRAAASNTSGVRGPRPRRRAPDVAAGGYRDVLRHRPFLALTLLNVVFVSAGYTQLELLPVFAKNEAGVSEDAIGLVFLVYTLATVLFQLPMARLVEGRSRMRALALMPALWAAAWLVVEAGGVWLAGAAAAVVFGAGAIVFGIGGCLDGPTRSALVADLAPPGLQGRYWAISANSWDLGYIAGPAAGGFVLAAAPLALWPLAAGVCAAAALAALGLERAIPREHRLTPSAQAL